MRWRVSDGHGRRESWRVSEGHGRGESWGGMTSGVAGWTHLALVRVLAEPIEGRAPVAHPLHARERDDIYTGERGSATVRAYTQREVMKHVTVIKHMNSRECSSSV